MLDPSITSPLFSQKVIPVYSSSSFMVLSKVSPVSGKKGLFYVQDTRD